jgi:hypothetical protein
LHPHSIILVWSSQDVDNKLLLTIIVPSYCEIVLEGDMPAFDEHPLGPESSDPSSHGLKISWRANVDGL